MYSMNGIPTVLSWTLSLLIVQIIQQVSTGQFIEPAFVDGQTLELDHKSTMDALNIGYIAEIARANNISKHLKTHHRGVHRSLATAKDDNDHDDHHDRARAAEGDETGFPEDCGQVNPNKSRNKIAGGYSSKEGEYPSYVKLEITPRFDLSRQILCGGVIVNSRYVFTAAHCVDDAYAIAVSPTWNRSPTKTYYAAKWCVSSKYIDNEYSIYYDFAVIRISETFKFGKNVQPACVPRSPILDSQQAYSVGLGLTEAESIKYPGSRDRRPEVLQVLPVRKRRCSILDRASFRICFKANNLNYRGDSCQGERRG